MKIENIKNKNGFKILIKTKGGADSLLSLKSIIL